MKCHLLSKPLAQSCMVPNGKKEAAHSSHSSALFHPTDSPGRSKHMQCHIPGRMCQTAAQHSLRFLLFKVQRQTNFQIFFLKSAQQPANPKQCNPHLFQKQLKKKKNLLQQKCPPPPGNSCNFYLAEFLSSCYIIAEFSK